MKLIELKYKKNKLIRKTKCFFGFHKKITDPNGKTYCYKCGKVFKNGK